MAMSVAEARTEIKSNYEKADLIEKKYPDGEITNGEDLAEVKRLLTEIDVLEAKLSGLEDAEARRNRILSGIDRFRQTGIGLVANLRNFLLGHAEGAVTIVNRPEVGSAPSIFQFEVKRTA